ncbi:uncharacterized protein N7477_003183 [Penicillium maclennaniae]|uniref:uncharacterized protein n=1 Tax=Penicillium maclennaniae TaxID=1343394 RepID=UPI002542620B|nr:uncharacterized protein N7477_003183 [Penicillium maclennaniae]KAJ5677550.1 hypothetical protein N7477_003183 [Penicillium maclennaniae]
MDEIERQRRRFAPAEFLLFADDYHTDQTFDIDQIEGFAEHQDDQFIDHADTFRRNKARYSPPASPRDRPSSAPELNPYLPLISDSLFRYLQHRYKGVEAQIEGGGVRDLQAPPPIPVRVGLDVNNKALDTVSFGPTSTLYDQDKVSLHPSDPIPQAISPVVPPHPDIFIRRSERLAAKHALETHEL